MRICNCALPALHNGSTKCCEECPNNYDREDVQISQYPLLVKVPKRTTKIYEYDQDGRVIKEIITEE